MKTPIATKTDGVDRPKSQTLKETTGNPPEGSLYIHVPFCSKKCPYCHFFVLPYDQKGATDYIATLKKEWTMRKEHLSSLTSIYFGGGTPSLLTPAQVEEILTHIDMSAREITLEANPETVTLSLMRDYKSLGVNRISIGVQSLDDTSLQEIGREHSANKAIDAILLTQKAGITNISIDLMYDLPRQTLPSWQKTIDQVALLPITHLSLYNLTFEPGSSYFKHQKKLSLLVPDEEKSLQMLTYAVETLENHGLKRYEISAFAKENQISLHNTGYWTARPFIGIGPSAFSYLNGRRFQNHAHLKKWQTAIESNQEATSFEERLPYPDNLHELLAIRLRLLEGVSLDLFPTLPKETERRLLNLQEEGYLSINDRQAKLTDKGRLFYDSVATAII